MEQFAPYLVEEPEVKPNMMDCVSFPTLPSSTYSRWTASTECLEGEWRFGSECRDLHCFWRLVEFESKYSEGQLSSTWWIEQDNVIISATEIYNGLGKCCTCFSTESKVEGKEEVYSFILLLVSVCSGMSILREAGKYAIVGVAGFSLYQLTVDLVYQTGSFVNNCFEWFIVKRIQKEYDILGILGSCKWTVYSDS